jgi:hypothetical protein
MRKSELLDVLNAIDPDPRLEEFARTQLARRCAERVGIREIERHLFEALHARVAARATTAATLGVNH